MTNDERPQGVTDFEEAAWCLIANASGGDWTRESDEWRAAAARWREQYHAKLSAALQPAAAAQGDAEPVWWALTSKYGTRFYSTESQMRDEAQPEEVIVPLYAAPPSAQGVPREPTEAMLRAKIPTDDPDFSEVVPRVLRRSVWCAMYDAALAAQGEQAGGGQN